MEDKLDRYLRESNNELKNRSRPATVKKRKPDSKPTPLKKWASSAAMDLFFLYMPLIFCIIIGVVLLLTNSELVIYCLYGTGLVLLVGVIYSAIDYNKFFNWTERIHYPIEGWKQILNSRTAKFWDMNGEYWISVKIVILVNEPVTEKHFKVLEVFLKKLRKRLNQWTVSKEKHIGYSQPNGWNQEGLIVTGDMNPRVLNLIRKRFSGELDKITRLMPGVINKVSVTQTGSEKYHQVYTDPTSD